MEEEAQDEILDLLDMFGDPDAESEITEIKGLLLAQTALDPFEVIEKLEQSSKDLAEAINKAEE